MCSTAYFLLATTVHPWYITSLVLLSVITSYRYPVVWSVLIILSYAAYRTVPYSENLWLVAVEYIVVFGCIGYELVRKAKSFVPPSTVS
jgi:alpha-1,6-mannosyltransferase